MDSVPRLSTRFNQRGVIVRNVNWLDENLSRAREVTGVQCRGTGRVFARDGCGNKHRCHTQRITNLY